MNNALPQNKIFMINQNKGNVNESKTTNIKNILPTTNNNMIVSYKKNTWEYKDIENKKQILNNINYNNIEGNKFSNQILYDDIEFNKQLLKNNEKMNYVDWKNVPAEQNTKENSKNILRNNDPWNYNENKFKNAPNFEYNQKNKNLLNETQNVIKGNEKNNVDNLNDLNVKNLLNNVVSINNCDYKKMSNVEWFDNNSWRNILNSFTTSNNKMGDMTTTDIQQDMNAKNLLSWLTILNNQNDKKHAPWNITEN